MRRALREAFVRRRWSFISFKTACRSPVTGWRRGEAGTVSSTPGLSRSWTLGGYDVVAIYEAPDDESALALAASVGSRGKVRSQTLRAFSFDEMKRILGKMV